MSMIYAEAFKERGTLNYNNKLKYVKYSRSSNNIVFIIRLRRCYRNLCCLYQLACGKTGFIICHLKLQNISTVLSEDLLYYILSYSVLECFVENGLQPNLSWRLVVKMKNASKYFVCFYVKYFLNKFVKVFVLCINIYYMNIYMNTHIHIYESFEPEFRNIHLWIQKP